MDNETAVKFMRSIAGYPFLPCPICHGNEGCDHSIPERARAAGHNLIPEHETRQ
jgi:hypothetical protein